MTEAGELYLVATPIGNLEDITLRALRILKEVDLIAAEDTRTVRKILNRYGIKTHAVSYYDASEKIKSRNVIDRIKKGRNVALVSEAGMPGISDPGYRLIREAIREGIKVIPVPGASALISALVASGLPVDRFAFEGFLPPGKTSRRRRIFQLRDEERTTVFYVSPRRLYKVLKDMQMILGKRRAVVAREMTKKFEEFIRGDLKEISDRLKGIRIRGEIVLILEGGRGKPGGSYLPLPEQIENARKILGCGRMEAIKLVAGLRGRPKSEIYRILYGPDQKAEGPEDSLTEDN